MFWSSDDTVGGPKIGRSNITQIGAKDRIVGYFRIRKKHGWDIRDEDRLLVRMTIGRGIGPNVGYRTRLTVEEIGKEVKWQFGAKDGVIVLHVGRGIERDSDG